MSSMGRWLTEAARLRADGGVVRTATAHDRAGPPMLDLAANDYLGLANDPRVTSAAIEAVERYGAGARASRVVTGTTPAHDDVERELRALTGRPAALAFSSGYAANLAVLTSLGGPDCLIVSDQHIHASLIDAARLSRSPVVRIPHSDIGAVRDALAGRIAQRAIVVVESVYSVLGDSADLGALAQICADHDAVLVVDEAHGIGVLGVGRGGVHATGLAEAGHVVVTATFSKALGSQGGAILGTPELRDHLINSARTFIFDTGLAPAAAAAAAEACRIIVSDPRLVDGIRRNADVIAAACGIGRASGAVQSVRVGAAADAEAIAADLRGAGIMVGCFRPPSVPDGVSRIRLTARADLESSDVGWAAKEVAHAVTARTGHAASAGLAASNGPAEGSGLRANELKGVRRYGERA